MRLSVFFPLVGAVLLLAACSSVDVKHVDTNGKDLGGVNGLYVPKMLPYLLVSELPPTGPGDKDPTSAASQGSTSDLSYSAIGAQYVLKLVYLPDYSHQQAISVQPGLFGASSIAATFLNGSMLSMNGSTDNTKLLDAVAQIASSAVSSGKSSTPGGKAASTASTATKKYGLSPVVVPASPLLAPGLYQFVYTDAGVLTGLKLMTGFPIQ